jgi:predicted XRE-type DNA-binding protein
MTEERFASVWDAIENSPASAANMKTRASLMMMLNAHIGKQGWTQAEAARRLGVTQPRISDLKRGKVDLFGIDALITMLSAAGLELEFRVKKAA